MGIIFLYSPHKRLHEETCTDLAMRVRLVFIRLKIWPSVRALSEHYLCPPRALRLPSTKSSMGPIQTPSDLPTASHRPTKLRFQRPVSYNSCCGRFRDFRFEMPMPSFRGFFLMQTITLFCILQIRPDLLLLNYALSW